jgi:hypothetical protein
MAPLSLSVFGASADATLLSLDVASADASLRPAHSGARLSES